MLILLTCLLAGEAAARIVIDRVTPPEGPSTGGTALRIEGSGFFGSCVSAPCEDRSLTIGSVPADSFQIVSESLILATTPPLNSLAVYTRPVIGHVRVGTEEALFTFYYSDVQAPPSLHNFERVLLPAHNCHLRGAYGSEWCADLQVYNSGEESTTIYPVYPDPRGVSIAALMLPPGRVAGIGLLRSIASSFTETAPVSARVLYIDPEHADDVHMNVRLYDQSRTSMTWGTDIPVVRERDLFGRPIQIFPVPMATRFRTALRVYDPHRTPDASVAVTFYSVAAGHLLGSRVLTLQVLTRELSPGVIDVSYPGLAELGNLSDLPELSTLNDNDSIRIVVESLTPGLKLWAMVSVTNDETQHVTLLTPTGVPSEENELSRRNR